MRCTLLIWGLVVLVAGAIQAQSQPFNNPKLGVVYNQERVLDLRVQPMGWTVGMTFGRLATYYRTPFYYIGIGELRHNKETRSNYDLGTTGGGGTKTRQSRPYVLGKQNNLFVIRGGYGVKRYWSEKTTDRGVAVATVLQGGFSLGLLKPYYLYLRKLNESNFGYVSSLEGYSESNATTFTDPNSIQGAGGFWQGLEGIRPTPGLHIRAGVQVDSGAFDEFVRAAEVGISGDFFPKAAPIMLQTPNQRLFLNLYLSLQFGKRT